MTTVNFSEPDSPFNIASLLSDMARQQPYKRAVVFPAGRDRYNRVAYSHLTFRQLDKESDCIAHGLNRIGIGRGTRTILMVKPSLEFFALVFALFKAGAIPVVVDPGMGLRRLMQCLQESRPEAFIGIPLAHLMRILYPRFFHSVKVVVTVGKRWFWGGHTLNSIRDMPWSAFPMARTTVSEPAAILFTTGSTGPAKGAVYSHGNFGFQIQTIRTHFDIGPDEIDLPTFPLFALFDPALGMTAIIPDMDPTKPARANPERLVEAIVNQGVTNMFASPALLKRLGAYGQLKGIKLPSLQRVVSAGAPVSPELIAQFSGLLGRDAQVHTPYGATEAVPITSIASHEILTETRSLTERGFGVCVGRALENLQVRSIKISDTPIRNWSEDLVVQDMEIGEIVVKGALVTRGYFDNPEADALAKIHQNQDIWHRMGDLGWRDNKGRIWFCGRKSHRLMTSDGPMFTIPCEAIFNTHAAVSRSALVGIGPPENMIPVICIERNPEARRTKPAILREELLALAAGHVITKGIQHILFNDDFPVDVRHNAKIFREKLAIWAARRIKLLPDEN